MDAVARGLARSWDRFGRLGPAGPLLDGMLKGYCRDRRLIAPVDCGRMELDLNDPLSRMLWVFRTWEPNLSTWLKGVLKPGDGFIDLGANVGYYTLLAKSLVGDGPVWSFEASPTIFRQLQRNIELNGHAVKAYNLAVSDRDGEVEIHLGDNQGLANIFGGGPTEAVVPARALDTVLADEDVSRVRVIKIDVEGAEDLALAGMQKTWDRLPPTADFMTEVSDKIVGHDRDAAAVMRMFAERGYRPYVVANDYNPSTYRRADRYVPPRPFEGPVVGTVDLIFSKTGLG
jgi:FkbM family methyltransferase